MSAQIISFPKARRVRERAPVRLLRQVATEEPAQVIVLGWDGNGHEFFVSTISDGAEVMWLLESAKHRLINIVSGSGH